MIRRSHISRHRQEKRPVGSFSFPGVTVKNLQAFQVLQNVFHKASDALLCTHVLSAIRTMWAWNARNFFLLEWTLQPISQFVELVPLKPAQVQTHFFQLLEALVFELRYVPHEILGKVQRLIMESSEPLCTLRALQSVLRIAGVDPLFTDIFRDSGLLGLLLAQLRKRAKVLRKSGVQKPGRYRGTGWASVSWASPAGPPCRSSAQPRKWACPVTGPWGSGKVPQGT